MAEIRANSVLPARREPIRLETSDGLTLVGELAVPLEAAPQRPSSPCIRCPRMGNDGFPPVAQDRVAASALADIAVLRFNTRGTSSSGGTSEGSF